MSAQQIQPVHLKVVASGLYENETNKAISYRDFLRLFCPENCGRKINICIISKDTYRALEDFASVLIKLKGRNNELRHHVKKYKVFAFQELEQLENKQIAQNIHIVFHWLN